MTLVVALFVQVLAASNPPTPVRFDDFNPLNYEAVASRPWQPPDYSGQGDKMGYSDDAFAVPSGFEKRMQFWRNVYATYNTHQGLLHDADNVEIVYEVLDFHDIEQREDLKDLQKEKLRRQRVDASKKFYKGLLKKLAKIDSPQQLSGEELRIWKAFESVDEKNKFVKATSRERMRFQLGQKDRFQQAIYYSGRYIEEMEDIFDEMNLPRELVRMVYVESSFNVYAVSRVGASGLWQIMPRTGRQLLKMNRAIDMRNHPIEATKAAAKLLRQNYRMLKSWPLAVTGYNHGAWGVRRLVRRHKTRKIEELVEINRAGRNFGFASRNFYAAFLAALQVEQQANKVFENVTWSPVLEMSEVRTLTSMTWAQLVKWFNGDTAKARLYNPHLTYRVRKRRMHIPRKSVIHVPSSSLARVKKDMQKFLKAASAKYQRYRVVRGDTLEKIAYRFGVSMRRIKDINDLRSIHQIRIGQVLRIPQE